MVIIHSWERGEKGTHVRDPRNMTLSCADPGIFDRGGGVQT